MSVHRIRKIAAAAAVGKKKKGNKEELLALLKQYGPGVLAGLGAVGAGAAAYHYRDNIADGYNDAVAGTKNLYNNITSKATGMYNDAASKVDGMWMGGKSSLSEAIDPSAADHIREQELARQHEALKAYADLNARRDAENS